MPALVLLMACVVHGSNLSRKSLVDNIWPVCTELRLIMCNVLLFSERTRLTNLRPVVGKDPLFQAICGSCESIVIRRYFHDLLWSSRYVTLV